MTPEAARAWRARRDALVGIAREIPATADGARIRQAWQDVLAHDPINSVARAGLVTVLRREGRHADIEQEYARYAADLKDHPDRELRLAQLADIARLTDLALKHTLAGLVQQPDNLRRVRWAIAFFVRRGMVRRACDLLDRQLEDAGAGAAAGATDEVLSEFRKTRAQLIETLARVGWEVETQGLPPEEMDLHDEVVRALCESFADRPRHVPVPGRVLLVLPSFGPGGVQRQTLNLVGHTAARRGGVELFVALPLKADRNLDFYREAFEAKGAVLADSMASEGGEGVDPPAFLSSDQVALVRQLPDRTARQIFHIARQIGIWRPQVVHCWSDPVNITGGIAAALAGVPRIVLGARSSAPRGVRASTVASFTRAAYAHLLDVPGVVLTTNSRAAAREFEDWLSRDRGSVVTVYNGIDLIPPQGEDRATRAAELRASLGIPPRDGIVGAAFRLSPEKRPFLWLEAAAYVIRHRPDTHFVLLGDGSLQASLADWVKTRDLSRHIHLPGLTSEIPDWIEAFDVLFLTSLYEGTANIALEAQALGCPVVLPDVGGLAETFIPGETGLLLQADPTPQDCADRLIACLDRPDYADAARTRGPDLIRSRFGLDALVAGYLEVYGLTGETCETG